MHVIDLHDCTQIESDAYLLVGSILNLYGKTHERFGMTCADQLRRFPGCPCGRTPAVFRNVAPAHVAVCTADLSSERKQEQFALLVPATSTATSYCIPQCPGREGWGANCRTSIRDYGAH